MPNINEFNQPRHAYPVKESYGQRAKISDGLSVVVTVPADTEVKAHQFYEADGFLGAAFETVKTGAGETAEVALNIEEAEYETNQIAEGDYERGTALYWTGEEFSTTGTRFAGRVTTPESEEGYIHFKFFASAFHAQV